MVDTMVAYTLVDYTIGAYTLVDYTMVAYTMVAYTMVDWVGLGLFLSVLHARIRTASDGVPR